MLSPEVRPASFAASSSVRARHQRLDALVHVAEPLLQPHHVLAIGGEAEMPGLDDAGMHRPDRNLVQAFAFDRQERVRRGRLRGLLFAERMAHIPKAEIEPGPRVRCAGRLQPEESTDGAFQPDRRRMLRPDARVASIGAGVSDDGDIAGRLVDRRHVHVRRIAPQPEQRALARRQLGDRLVPALLGDGGAVHPSSLATFWKPLTSAGGR